MQLDARTLASEKHREQAEQAGRAMETHQPFQMTVMLVVVGGGLRLIMILAELH